MSLLDDLRHARRSLARSRGLVATVVATLALGIGANAAIFTLVQGVLLRPLVNRDEDRLIYIRQSAPGIGADNLTFSMPEIRDLAARVSSLTAFGDFSTIGFNAVGLGEPREVRAGVVSGSYFEVMGLRPVLGRLLDARDDGPSADGAVVLTHRFWQTVLAGDESVIGRRVRLDGSSATVVGVLEPSVPYPAETEIIANVVTSPHHLSATMVTGRVHRMTELFARLAPGADLETARAELRAAHAGMRREHPEAYPEDARIRVDAFLLRDQLTSRARTVLLVLLGAAILVFAIACSNAANLILARAVQREDELAVRAALGAGTWALRRTLLAESLLLCGAGAVLGVLAAGPMVSTLGRYAARFSVRALSLRADSSALAVGALLALTAAVLLAFVPRLPTTDGARAPGRPGGGRRIAGGAGRRLRVFATTQIAACFVLLVGASTAVNTLLALQAAETGLDVRHVLAVNVPVTSEGRRNEDNVAFYRETMRRVGALPGVDRVAVGIVVPWRDAGFSPSFALSAEGLDLAPGQAAPRAQLRTVSPGFFAALGVPLVAGRDFDERDHADAARVVIVSQSLAERLFPGREAVGRDLWWTDPVMDFIDVSREPRRIVGVARDVDDEHVVPEPALTVYHPFEQQVIWGGRLFVHVRTDPYRLVPAITRIVRDLSADQVVERAATLEDIRAEVLAPDRMNAVVFGGFAAVALAIAVVGVAGVLAFSVSRRVREFGIRLAVGSQPRELVSRVVLQGAAMAAAGIAAGALAGLALARLAGGFLPEARLPDPVPLLASALLLLIAALVASALPAARAARIDVVEALRSE